MFLKEYKDRNELMEDIQFIKTALLDEEYKSYLVNSLFDQWLYTGSDSPWSQDNDISAAETLVKISKEGVSSEWKGEHVVFEDVSVL